MSKIDKKKKGAPFGNQFWKMVQKPTGRPKKYTPESLWNKAVEYFAWVDANPLIERRVFANGLTTDIDRLRPMTEIAFCLFADIDQNTLQRYKGEEEYKEFWGVTDRICQIIYVQKFEGACADFFNSNIISRELGLIDRQKYEIDLDNLSEEDAQRVAKYVLAEHQKNTR